MRNIFKLDIREDLDTVIREQDKRILQVARVGALQASKLLEDDEKVTHAVACKVDGTAGVLVLTDRRVLAVWGALLSGGSESLPVSKVTQVDAGLSGLKTWVKVKGSGAEIKVTGVGVPANALVSELRRRVE